MTQFKQPRNHPWRMRQSSEIREIEAKKATATMKQVAKSIKELATSDILARVLDPNDPVDDVIDDLKKRWSYDLYARRPGPALLEHGVLKPTDLDLACFMSALADRKAVINIPSYKSRRTQTTREGEHIVSKDNRHGHVLGLTANKSVFSFSVRINDVNVISSDGSGKDTVGAVRNFMLVDLEGGWYDGWKKIEFLPSRKENDFLAKNSLWTDNVVYFDNFVHPNRWVSFYGQWYLLTKILVQRLRAEVTFRNSEVKALQAEGIALPAEGPDAAKEWPEQEVGESRAIVVDAFEAEVDADVPDSFAPSPRTQQGLIAARKRASKLRYYDVPELNFALRATELSFAQRVGLFPAVYGKLAPPFPSWISGAKWEEHTIKRTTWNRLVLHQAIPFTKGLALRYRVYKKTERVAPER